MVEPVYDIDGATLHPRPIAGGPWFPGVQHGGAVAGVIARAIEQTPTVVPMDLTRLTIELVRKVPMGPTTVEVEVTREGRRIQGLALRVVVDDQVVTTATALRIRTEEGAVESALLDGVAFSDAPSMRPPEESTRFEVDQDRPDFWNCFDCRTAISVEETGAVEMGSWYKMLHPLVAGEENSPTVRLVCTADFAMSASWLLGFDDYLSPNPDLTVSLRRPLLGDWVGLYSRVWADTRGIGQSEAVILDGDGQVGRATKSLMIAKRDDS